MKSILDVLHERFVTKEIHTIGFEPDVRQWLDFLDSLPEAKSNIEKSYNKFLCRMYFFPAYKRFIMNLFGFFAEFIILAYVILSNKSLEKRHKGILVLERSRAVPDFSDLVPEDLYKKYNEIIVVDNYNKKFGLLCRETRKLWFTVVKRYPFSFFFHYWVFMELAAHSHFLMRYNPEATAVYVNERNVVSPIISELYESQGRMFISFMHGEYLLHLVLAHMKFSQYYIWDKSYIEMFRDILRCDADFITYKPGKLNKHWHLENSIPEYYCTYYFDDTTEMSVNRIKEIFQEFNKRGKKCKIRLHPRDIVFRALITKTFTEAGIKIEDNKAITLEQSLSDTQYAVGMQTTVLFEALAEGRDIVIDDVSDPKHFKNMLERRYRLLQEKHILLSDFLENEI